MNEVLNCLLTRRSVKKYLSQPVEKEKLDAVLEAGTYAATGMGKQSPVIVVVQKPELIAKLLKMNAAVMGTTSDPFYGAPTVLVVCYDQNEVWHNPFDPTIDSGEIDASIVADEMILAAWDEGIASCWVAHFNPKKINSGLKIQEHIRPVVLIPIGYAEDGVEPALRHTESKDLDEIVHEL